MSDSKTTDPLIKVIGWVISHAAVIVSVVMAVWLVAITPLLIQFIVSPPVWFDSVVDSETGHRFAVWFGIVEVIAILAGGVALAREVRS